MTERDQDEATPEQASGCSCGDPVPQASRWRIWAARAIDLTIVAIVLALFFTPVVIVEGFRQSAPALLRASAWVYVAVFLGFTIAFRFRKRRPADRARYVTVGMSILDLRVLRTDRTVQLVRSQHAPDISDVKGGRAAAVVALPLMAFGLLLVFLELVSYTT